MRLKKLLAAEAPQQNVEVRGWVRTLRASKEVCFIELNDGSCFASLQLVADRTVDNFAELAHIGTGACIKASGNLVDSPAKGQRWELHVSELTVIGNADPSYPLQKKRHTFEYLRSIAHLRPRSNTFGAVFRLRNALSYAVHQFFQQRDFLYVHTPIITASDCEGAGELFRVTTLDPANPPKNNGRIDWQKDFFGARTGLTVSGQLQGELFATAFSDIYTFGPTFRAENSNTSRHASEFWMIEPEIAFANLADDCQLAEDFLRYLVKYALEHCAEDLQFFNDRIEKGLLDKLTALADATFSTMTYTEAIEQLKNSGQNFEFPVEWGLDLQSEHERYLCEQVVNGPLFVTDYPKEIKAFYMRANEDGKTVAAMDLLVPRVGEIIGGSQREERLDVLTARMEELDMAPESLDWYLDIRRWGSCPHAGFGLGFERLIMYLSGMENIRDVIPFPRTPGHAEF
ncbi:asparagine--tRNA ligase [Desulfuromonas acetoxidans]|uniref:Asparagine--tRNA ligase n=1 Tax=Desulfuromonas acetoxidans (strain DSM 684 / 11070) TaxID=281689 RepID=Q1JYI9_DESA6|nr:asparagine--tRNA ligase [Desulfuromonas acetoxidans]EAT15217.1 asparaginyl-tRNA synthetase [Desulfuromonas acetoxidans DSM 684]MBF0646679.1 asparagine--tRNA ligase [Desulfuromonas acetoxidans]NVD26001.1 asparagine--tRNA ligase [Desulfuromonas acetoxidans]NVE17905.1 asparagine--tRNA ligase [Desulfuromonas acetoxidans]